MPSRKEKGPFAIQKFFESFSFLKGFAGFALVEFEQ
jgi:hypothetical protein